MTRPTVVFGLGITGRAVVDVLLAEGAELVVIDDRPTESVRSFVADRGLELIVAPDEAQITQLLADVQQLVPSPGLPDAHPVMRIAMATGVPIRSEFDLARERDDRPVAAVTGTDGKTTVTTMVAEMFTAAGIPAALAGNNDVPLVAAIADPAPRWFVVEASSFRLGHSHRFAPQVATWLNFAPDHLDAHTSLDAYAAAKATIFAHQSSDDVAIGNADDPVVMQHLNQAPARTHTFSDENGDYRVVDQRLVTPDGDDVIEIGALPRRGPHHVANALAATATAMAAGVSRDAVASVLGSFTGLPHRTQLVAEIAGVRFVDDSKATAPHAVVAAISGEESVVLIAGGRNKGIDLSPMAGTGRVRSVVAIGEAASDVETAFRAAGVPVVRAGSMAEAVKAAADRARPGDTVLLSPGCASHDWYQNFAERGADFARVVNTFSSGERSR